MKLLVTGGTGFIGRALVDACVKKYKLDVYVATRHIVNDFPGAVKQLSIDAISSETNWHNALQLAEVVIHTAAHVHVMHGAELSSQPEFRKVNTDGTLNFARQAAGAGIRRFVYLSSIKVNGEQTQPGCAFTSEDSPAPIDPYSISKYEAEQGLIELANETGMEVVIIRPPLVYGPGVKANFLSMMCWLDKGIPLPFGAIKNKRSLVALDNLVDLIIRCIEHPAAANEIFLVSDGEDLSTTDLLKRMAIALNKPSRLIPVPEIFLKTLAVILGKRDISTRLLDSLQVDIEKTKRLLNWIPPVSVDDALKMTAEDFLRNT